MNENGSLTVTRSTETPDQHEAVVLQVTKPSHRPRKGHTKSRRGCIVCKRRKVKCDEVQPRCRPCLKRGVDCKYASVNSSPATTQSIENAYRLAAPPRASLGVLIRPMPPSSLQHGMDDGPGSVLFTTRSANRDDSHTAPVLDLKSIRLFHHFITVAYPHLPAGNERVWTDKIPLIAQQREYLMHAVLGLAATHLHLGNQLAIVGHSLDPRPYNRTYKSLGIRHRGAAISGLNEALAKASWDQIDLDAMLATAYALTFQATYMQDGLTDFMTMVRGCALLTHRIVDSGHGDQIDSTFNLDPLAHIEILDDSWERVKPLPASINLKDGITALCVLKPFCQSAIQKELFDAIDGAYTAFNTSPRDGFIQYCKIFTVWHDCNAVDFAELVAEGQSLIRVLLSFYLAIELFVAPAFSHRYKNVRRTDDLIVHRMHMAISWIRAIHDSLDSSEIWRDRMAWPVLVGSVVESQIPVPLTSEKR
jgi:hypothetical protein